MLDDPYRVLGLTPDATDEQVKQAYRRLAKQYHPDMNPGDEAAARRMNEINAAYDQIKNPPKQTTYQNAYDPFSGWRHTQSEQTDGSLLTAARNYIRFGSFSNALNVLNSMPAQQRTAEWYYLSAIANSQLGNYVLAVEQIGRAVEMEPENEAYRRAMQDITAGGRSYSSDRQTWFSAGDPDLRCCAACIAANICCNARFCIFPCC